MKKLKQKLVIKIMILILGGGLLAFTALDLYRYLVRAETVDEKFVQFYRPQLNTELIKKAAEILEGKEKSD